MMQLETTKCPLCESEEARFVWPARDRRYGIPGNFAFVRCAHCGLLYLNPRPTSSSIWIYYPGDYEPFIKRQIEALPLWERYSLRYGLWKRCRLVLRYKHGGRLLDLGCGTGQFLAELRRYSGWEVIGIEPNPEAADFGRKMLGLLILEDLFSAQFPGNYFDVVTMWDVIEHLHEPVSVLQEINRILNPAGILILRTPSLDSWDARVFGPYWSGLDAPRHLAVYSHHTIEKLLTRTGFVVRDFKSGSGSYFVIVLSIRFWLEEIVPFSSIRKLLFVLVKNPLARLALVVPLAIMDRLGLGSEMIIVASKKQ